MAPALEVIIDCNRCTSDRIRAAKLSSDLLSSMKITRTQPSVPTSSLGKRRPHKAIPQATPNVDMSSSYLKVKAFARSDGPNESAASRTIGAINLPGHSMGVASRAASSALVRKKAYPQRAPASEETLIQKPAMESSIPVTPAPKKKIAVSVPSRALSGEVSTPNVPKPSPMESIRGVNDLFHPHSIEKDTARNTAEVLPSLSKPRTSSPETVHKPTPFASVDSKLKTSRVRSSTRPLNGASSATKVCFVLDSSFSTPGFGSNNSAEQPVMPAREAGRFQVPRPARNQSYKASSPCQELRPIPTARVAVPTAGSLRGESPRPSSPRPEYLLCTTREARAVF